MRMLSMRINKTIIMAYQVEANSPVIENDAGSLKAAIAMRKKLVSNLVGA